MLLQVPVERAKSMNRTISWVFKEKLDEHGIGKWGLKDEAQISNTRKMLRFYAKLGITEGLSVKE